MVNIDKILGWCVAEAKRDYIGLWQIIDYAERAEDIDQQLPLVEKTLLLVRAFLKRGFQAVDLIDHGGCIAWPDQNPDAVVDRIRRERDTLGQGDDFGYICWFNLPDELQDHPPAQV
ncbi:hypothetical protein [Roseomonas gilardii]|uniref:hypothetical protein n=1 Tax=Roseomonas gilardii TaxID=257708 RepID=UPI000DFF270D|nr:hypothetical protein [Roseomonas gilardii]SUE43691.1 Uncharacterised protein [Roseomonas gilardii subsp. rosea]